MFLCHSPQQQSHERKGTRRSQPSLLTACRTLDSSELAGSPLLPGCPLPHWSHRHRGAARPPGADCMGETGDERKHGYEPPWSMSLLAPCESLACQGNAVAMQWQCRLCERLQQQAQGKSSTQTIQRGKMRGSG